MKQNIKRFLSLVLCLTMVLVSVVPIFGKTITTTETIYTSKETYYLPLWHYSGNYWIIGSGSDAEKVTDKEISLYGGIGQYLTDNYTSVDFSVDIPSVVKEAISQGSTVKVKLGSRGNADWKSIFVEESKTVTSDLTSPTGKYEFSLQPIFHLVRNKNYTDFVPDLTHSIPLIHYRYGSNIYSIFGNGKNAVQADGYFDEGATNAVFSPYIHPTIISNTKGELASGHPITVGGDIVASDGYRVGDGTFVNAGAVGIMFCFPINVIFEKVTTTWVDDPAHVEGNTKENTEDNPPAIPDEPVQPAPDKPGISNAVSALLHLPKEAYEGQTIAATDVSTIEIGGTSYTAAEALEGGLAEHTFDAPGATPGKEGSNDLELTYDNSGTYPVTLLVETPDGESDSDTKCVTIKPCPSVSVILGGCQKQNRKQSLDIRVQQHPKYPISSLVIYLTELESGETIVIHRNFKGAQTPPANSEHIKYRTLYDTDPDEFRVACRLDFLSKFCENKTFRYTVTATDSRGKSDTKTADFTVIKDTPPIAAIAIDDIYYRSKGSDTATITVSDASQGLGNFLRTWTYEGSNFKDLSFGTQREISFERKGVGPFSVGLTVKDMWTEETLEEYITDEDHLSASTSASSVVGNIAPVVSFGMDSEKTAELLLLAKDDETEKALNAAIPGIVTKLTSSGIKIRINVERSRSSGVKTAGTISRLGIIDNPIPALGSVTFLDDRQKASPFWSTGHVTADDGNIYIMDSSNTCISNSQSMYKTLKRTYPYTITAYDMKRSKVWKFILPETILYSSTDFNNAHLAHDEQGRYLYLISDGKTLILNKSDGTLLRVTNEEMGLENYVSANGIYTVKSDGIFRLESDGLHPVTSLQAITGSNLTRLIRGSICFISSQNGSLNYCVFDPETETISKVALPVSDTSSVIAIDTRGYAVIREASGNVKVFSSDGKCIGNASMKTTYDTVVPCFDASGNVNYVCGSYCNKVRSKGETAYYNHVIICGLFTGDSCSDFLKSSGNDYYNQGAVAYALEDENGTVSMVQPCYVPPYSYDIIDSILQFNYNPSSGAKSFGILKSTGLPPTGFAGWFEGGCFIPVYNTSANDDAILMRHQESEEGELARLKTKWLRGDCDQSLCLSFGGDFSEDDLVKLVQSKFTKPDLPVKTYSKGQKITYNVYYSDWEDDPSKASYWVYTHEPGTDGLWAKSDQVLSSPVTSFEKNGKYTLTHWQTDDAGRGLTDAYDKASAPCTMVFYISDGNSGGGSGNEDGGSKGDGETGGDGKSRPPVVKTISTAPVTIYSGDDYTISTVVSDPDNDPLDVTIEVYVKGNDLPVFEYVKKRVTPTGGDYPVITAGSIPKAEPGTYEIVVTASDGTGTGTGTYAFTPKIKASLTASVFHTDAWDSNRQNFNLKYFGKTFSEGVSDYDSYRKASSPRIRGKNVFWPGEELKLSADLKGNVVSVKAVMVGFDYKASLTATGRTGSDGTQHFTGTMYDTAMKTSLAKGNPRQVTIRFTASFKDGTTLTFDVPIIFDQDIGYWMLHRTK